MGPEDGSTGKGLEVDPRTHVLTKQKVKRVRSFTIVNTPLERRDQWIPRACWPKSSKGLISSLRPAKDTVQQNKVDRAWGATPEAVLWLWALHAPTCLLGQPEYWTFIFLNDWVEFRKKETKSVGPVLSTKLCGPSYQQRWQK